jgi:hypothetical protein
MSMKFMMSGESPRAAWRGACLSDVPGNRDRRSAETLHLPNGLHPDREPPVRNATASAPHWIMTGNRVDGADG